MATISDPVNDIDNKRYSALRKKLANQAKSTADLTLTPGGIWGKVGIPRRGERLYKGLEQGFDYSNIEALLSIGFINKSELSLFTGITKSTLDRRKNEGHLNTQESDRLYRLVRLLEAATDLLSGDEHKANDWVRKGAKGLGGRAPIEMIRTAAETESVIDYIGRVKHGITV